MIEIVQGDLKTLKNRQMIRFWLVREDTWKKVFLVVGLSKPLSKKTFFFLW